MYVMYVVYVVYFEITPLRKRGGYFKDRQRPRRMRRMGLAGVARGGPMHYTQSMNLL